MITCKEIKDSIDGLHRQIKEANARADKAEKQLKQIRDATAIAAAPTDIAFLLAEVEMLQQQLRCEHSAFLQAKAFAESLAQKMSPWALCKACKFHEKECDSPISDGCELWEVAENV